MKNSQSFIDIFLHDLRTPWKIRAGFPVQLVFDQDRIQRIQRTDSGTDIPIIELEPEEIMLFLIAHLYHLLIKDLLLNPILLYMDFLRLMVFVLMNDSKSYTNT